MEILKKLFHIVAKTFKRLLIVAVVLFLLLILIGVLADNEELLEDAFVAPDISLKSATVNYVTKEGQEVSVPTYAGQIEILTSTDTKLEKVKEFISERGGKVVAQAPIVGIYIIEVSSGKEAELIEALFKEDWVTDAYPYTPLEKNQAEYILDFWEEPSRERSHGAAVCYYAIGQKECTKEILDRCFEKKNCQEAEWPMFYQILREIKANEDAPFITINLSLGPKTEDKNGKQLPITAAQTLYKSYFGMLIQILGRDDLESIKKTIIINSAGNSGVDLTSVFQSLSSRKGFSRLVVVGAVTLAGKIASYTNYSKEEHDIVYSVGGEKAIPMAGKQVPWTGTSFAAPQITCLLNNWFRKSPERAANPQELRDSVFDADARKDAKRDFQYRYRINPCLTKDQAEEPREEPKQEPKQEKPPSPPSIISGLKVETAVVAAPMDLRVDSSSCKRISSSDYEISVAGFVAGPNKSSLSVQVLTKDPEVTGGYGILTCSEWYSSSGGCSRKAFFDNKDSTVWSYTDSSYTDTTSAFDDRQTTFQIDLLFKLSFDSKVNPKKASVICQRETREEVLERWRTADGLPAKPPALNFSPPEKLTNAFIGKYYNYKFEASGGIPPYNFYLKSGSGTPPSGVSLYYSGALLGKPNQKESKTFTVCAHDHAFQEVCRNVALAVEDAPPPPPPSAPNCNDGKYNSCMCSDGKTYTCSQSDYYVAECLPDNKAKCVSTAPPPPPVPNCSDGKYNKCQCGGGTIYNCTSGYYVKCLSDSVAQCVSETSSNITGKWSGTYSSSCLGNRNWNADIVDNSGTVSGNFSESAGFIVNGSISGTYSDNAANLTVRGEYSATLKGTVVGNSFSGTFSHSCEAYIPGVGVRSYPSSGNFSGQKN